MSAADFTRFDDLVSRYLDDTLTEPGAAELVALLAEPPLAARFLEITRLNSEIAGLLAAPVPDSAMVELVRSDIEQGLAGGRPARVLRLRIADEERARGRSEVTVPVGNSSPPKRRQAARWLAWAAVLVAFASLAAVFLANRPRDARTAIVASVHGDVRCTGPRGERALTAGQLWQYGETLKTAGPTSTATMGFPDASRLDFGGNVIAINQSTRGGRRLELEHGDVRATVEKQPPSRPFSFATAEAEAIVKGAKLRLAAGSRHTRLEVKEGEVRLRRRHDGAEIIVKAGYFAVVAPNAPFAAAPFHAEPHHP